MGALTSIDHSIDCLQVQEKSSHLEGKINNTLALSSGKERRCSTPPEQLSFGFQTAEAIPTISFHKNNRHPGSRRPDSRSGGEGQKESDGIRDFKVHLWQSGCIRCRVFEVQSVFWWLYQRVPLQQGQVWVVWLEWPTKGGGQDQTEAVQVEELPGHVRRPSPV